MRSCIDRARLRWVLQGVGDGAVATGKQGRLADMLRISMSVEIASIDEVMRIYPGMAIEGFDTQFRTTVRSVSTGKPRKWRP
jgi:hypothetical protein